MSQDNISPANPDSMEARVTKIEEMLANLTAMMQAQVGGARPAEVQDQRSRLHSPRVVPHLNVLGVEDDVVIDNSPAMGKSESLENQKLKDKVGRLEHLIRNLKGVEDQIIDTEGLCFFPHVRLPEKFKWTSEKFDGRGDPRTHLRSFIGQLRGGRGFTDEQLGQAFQFSLTGAAHHWLMALDSSSTRTWDDMMKAFTRQYSYNTEIELTRRELETTKQAAGEGFTSYLKRFRDKAAQMWDRPNEREQVGMIVRGLRDPYRKFLFALPILNFDGLIVAAQQVEDAIFQEELPKVDRYATESSSSRRPPQQKSSGVNAIMPTLPSAAPTLSTMVAPFTLEQRTAPPNRPKRQFANLGASLSSVFSRLAKAGLISTIQPRPIPEPKPRWYNPDLFCHYHCQEGHTTDNCFNLKHAIQDLYDAKKFELRPKQPSVTKNPLPNHQSINALGEDLKEFDPTIFIRRLSIQSKGHVHVVKSDAKHKQIKTVEGEFMKYQSEASETLEMVPYFKKPNGQFIKEVHDSSYSGFSELWLDEISGKELPGFEIFFNCVVDRAES
ncbi:uncharacterized protein LOC122084475 [Macadamia integrifolia]|uniref:uncharacterized protein LOC122084475 n=1 Tax=Macadamia integrifolia TaxID=60698 RepID=UPI001C4E2EC5|nr:uncharacterized protein LOC122084475 [Macadamia integrifolia]